MASTELFSTVASDLTGDDMADIGMYGTAIGTGGWCTLIMFVNAISFLSVWPNE